VTAARRIVALACVVGAVAVGFLAFRGDDGDTASAEPAPLSSALYSPRRVPQPLVDGVGAQRLQGALDAVAGGPTSCFEVDAGRSVVASHDATAPLMGASTQKLLVAAAALTTLGPDSVLETTVVANGVEGGTAGRVWLVGGGDPVLTTGPYRAFLTAKEKTRGDVTTSLEALADAIVAKGVRRIPGGIVADDSRYDGVRYPPTWKASYATTGQVGPIGALTVNDGFGAWDPRNEVVDDPGRYAAEQLANLLGERGVDVGGVGRGAAPRGAMLVAQIESPPLRDVVASMLRSSDNVTAEVLTKELGVRTAGQGTTAAGTQAIVAKVRELGVPVDGLVLTDGSGLDRGNRDTCTTLLAVLGLAGRPELGVLRDGLPVAGQSGTLWNQLVGTPLAGRLRAKTGFLDGVSGLTGFLDGPRPLTFAFLSNGAFDELGGERLRVEVASILATYPDAPPADALVPAPVSASVPPTP
jgi:serine-type D-Ala-D-Ala carboxypeptidase/endopeptidase (penicillin-binding protein 4)